jgi:uncharacterized protein YqeY
MSLETRIMSKLKEAMKAKDKTALEALRAVKSAILLEKTKSGTAELTEADELKLLQKLVKQRRDSAAIYQQQNRPDLAETELNQIAVIEQFLPKQMTQEEIAQAVDEIIKETGAQSMKDMGKVMGVASKKMAGKADSKTISMLVKEKLS